MFILLIVSLFHGDPVYELSYEDSAYGYKGKYTLTEGEGPYGEDAKELDVEIYFQTEDRLHVKIYDKTATYADIPDVIQVPEVTKKCDNPNYDVSLIDNNIKVTRKSDQHVVFHINLADSKLIYERQFIEVTTTTAKKPIIHGWGERRSRYSLPYPFNYTLMNHGRNMPDDGQELYGSHPFHVEVLNSGNAHGILFFNSFPMLISLDDGSIKYQAMGGMLDFYIFLGPSQKDVVKQYTDLVGKPCLVPQWAFGFHNCRWGFNNIREVMLETQTYRNNGMPLDVIWYDIDYLDKKKIFTTDPVNFPKASMKRYMQDQRQKYGTRTIGIIDPGIGTFDDYPAYKELINTGMYLKNPHTNKAYIGNVWPGDVIFPDFSNPNIEEYWVNQYQPFLRDVPFDGIWNDMNEISSFCKGYCDDTPPPQYPWVPRDYEEIRTDQVPFDLITHRGTYLETQQFYANQENIFTAAALRKAYPGRRPFIVTRAHWLGAGRTNVMWTGDNHANFTDMHDSIALTMTAGLYGMPYSGSDIGGHFDEVTAEILTRWVQMSSFLYPFYRNHVTRDPTPHPWYRFGEPWVTINRKFMFERQSIQSLFYTLMHEAHISGIPIIRSLSMEFPTDVKTQTIDRQAMLGDCLLVTPVLTEGATSVSGYFPAERWYDYYLMKEDMKVTMKGADVVVDADMTHCPVHIRGGSVLTKQYTRADSIERMKDTPLTLVAALSQKMDAKGQLIIDDGECDSDELKSIVEYTATASTFTAKVTMNKYGTEQVVKTVRILGLKVPSITSVSVSRAAGSFSFSYTPTFGVLEINWAQGWPVVQDFQVSWK